MKIFLGETNNYMNMISARAKKVSFRLACSIEFLKIGDFGQSEKRNIPWK